MKQLYPKRKSNLEIDCMLQHNMLEPKTQTVKLASRKILMNQIMLTIVFNYCTKFNVSCCEGLTSYN